MSKSLIPPRLAQSGRQILTGLDADSVDEYILLAVRDPLGFEQDAADEIASHLSDVEVLADSGLFRTLRGTHEGVGVTVCSTGSGAPETELAFVGLAELAPKGSTFIRVGTSGTARHDVRVGDLVITSAAVRSDGTTAEYVDPGYPAVAHPDVTLALAEAAMRLNHPHHVGITRSNDSLYAGQGRPTLGRFFVHLSDAAERWANLGVLNFEREASLILTLCNVFGFRGGSICTVANSAVQERVDATAGTEAAIATTLAAIKLLDERRKVGAGSLTEIWTPAMEPR